MDPRENVPDAGAGLPPHSDRDEEARRGQHEIQERGGAATLQGQAAPLLSVQGSSEVFRGGGRGGHRGRASHRGDREELEPIDDASPGEGTGYSR